MKHRQYFYGGGNGINQKDLADFKKETAEMALRGELSSNELHKRAEIIRLYQKP